MILNELFDVLLAEVSGIDHKCQKWSGGLGSKYIKIGEKMAVKHASEIMVLSKGVQEYFGKTYKRKTVFIPNGVSRPQTREAKEINLRWQGMAIWVVDVMQFFGCFTSEKRTQEEKYNDGWSIVKTL
ncbi:MAG: DUF1972 domain-containing protein [Lachnospiraceae bacterium]|nr:DUF1972 domain-containing protein [Lachnospiraceae bacterium]